MTPQDENYDLLATELPDGEGAGEGEQTNGFGGANGAEGGQDQPSGGGAQSNASQTGMQGERQPNKVRVTTPYLTKYERARVLGTRALQIRCESIRDLCIPYPPHTLLSSRKA